LSTEKVGKHAHEGGEVVEEKGKTQKNFSKYVNFLK
jgi:hypothetical protein